MVRPVITGAEMDIESFMSEKLVSYDAYAVNIPIIGGIIQFFSYIVAQFPILLFNILVFLCSIIIGITLCIRMIKIGIYQGIAPLFFGTVTSESTARYFQNFMVRYIALCIQIVIIAAVYSAFEIVFVNGFNGSWISGGNDWGVFLSFGIWI